MTNLKKNFIISLMGVDGAGKTSLAKILIKKNKNFKYLHLKPYILVPDLRRVIKDPHQQQESSMVISFLRLLGWLISYKFFFLKNKIKKIYIFDRYVHDVLIDPLRYKHNLYLVLTKFMLSFFPKPDLWIFLNPSFKTIKTRKFELSDKELKRQINEYTIFFSKKKNVLILNTKINKKKSIILIAKKIQKIIK